MAIGYRYSFSNANKKNKILIIMRSKRIVLRLLGGLK
jgi:hypothetical protein